MTLYSLKFLFFDVANATACPCSFQEKKAQSQVNDIEEVTGRKS